MNKIIRNGKKLGIVTSGVAYQYAREAFPKASFLKLGMTWPLPEKMIREFAASVEKLIVIEELDPFLELADEGLHHLGRDPHSAIPNQITAPRATGTTA